MPSNCVATKVSKGQESWALSVNPVALCGATLGCQYLLWFLFIFKVIQKERRHSHPCGFVNTSFVTLCEWPEQVSIWRWVCRDLGYGADPLVRPLQGWRCCHLSALANYHCCKGCFSSYLTLHPSILEGMTAQWNCPIGSGHRSFPALSDYLPPPRLCTFKTWSFILQAYKTTWNHIGPQHTSPS